MPRFAELLMGFQGPTSCTVVFLILLACGFDAPIPEDITLIAAGVLAYAKAANVWGMIAVGMGGALVGHLTLFLLGRRYGLVLAKRPFVAQILAEDRVERVSEILDKRGNKILFAARFMPGLRSPLFFTAGALGVPMLEFLFFDEMAAMLSVPAIIYSVYYFGDRMEDVIAAIQRANHGIVALNVLLVVAAVVKMRLGKRRAATVKPQEVGPTESVRPKTEVALRRHEFGFTACI